MTDQPPVPTLADDSPLPPGALDRPVTPSAAAILAGAEVAPPPAIGVLPRLDDTARHLLALADEPDGLTRIRDLLTMVWDDGSEHGREEIREEIREAAHQRATLCDERARIAAGHLPHDPNRAASEIRWATTLADQAGALRSLLH